MYEIIFNDFSFETIKSVRFIFLALLKGIIMLAVSDVSTVRHKLSQLIVAGKRIILSNSHTKVR